MAPAPKAIKAGYGARAHDVRAANRVKALASPGERPQEIFTPEPILGILRRAWGGIALDPCGHPDSLVCAIETWTGQQVPTGRTRADGSEILQWTGPGLVTPWRDRTFWNPPFVVLAAWMAHAGRQPGRWCGLFPVRSNRRWWVELATRVDGICWLNPVQFVGYSSAHPDKLCLLYRGPDVAVLVRETPREIGTWTGPLVTLEAA